MYARLVEPPGDPACAAGPLVKSLSPIIRNLPKNGDVLVQLNADGTVNEGDGPGYIVVTTTSHPAVQ